MYRGRKVSVVVPDRIKERATSSESKVEDREPYITYTANLNTRKILCGIPAYNEEIAIGSMVARSKQYVDEVFVVDDGSRDTTAETADLVGATVISHLKRLGKADGVRTTLGYAEERSFDTVVLIDGDGQHNPDQIPDLLDPVLNQEVDLCIGCRDGDTEIPHWRRIGKEILDLLIQKNLDTQSGFRALSESAIRVISEISTSKGFGIESEMVQIARKKGRVVQQIPVSCRYHGLNGSTLHPIRHGLAVGLSVIIGRISERLKRNGERD